MSKSLVERLVALKPKGRTVEQLAAELGISIEKTKALLQKPQLPDGYMLTPWKDHLGEQHFEVLPPEPPRPQPKPRAFRYVRARDPESYLRVFVPDDVSDANSKPAKFIELFPFSDVHWGHICTDKRSFLLDVKEVETRPNRLCFWNGDNMENALGDSAGGAAWAEQNFNPKVQRRQIEHIFRPIAHKVVAGHPGNHEWRGVKKALFDPLEEVAKGLDIPYFQGPFNLEIVWAGYRWTFHVAHGTTSSQLPGGKLNAAGRARFYNDFRNFFVMGHVHDEMSHKVSREVRRREFAAGKLVRFWTERMKEYKVICPSYLLYAGTYAEQEGYSPGSRNTVVMQMYRNGDYRVVSSKRQKNGDGKEQAVFEEVI